MCGRYALSLRPSEVRRQLEHAHMRVDEAPDDENARVRCTYNFAPGSHGLVYRAEGPERGSCDSGGERQQDGEGGRKYKLQAMKWGLIPFWTKRNPDYKSMLKTINCRDDSLYDNRGLWVSSKKKKRCIVVAQGFYEWKNVGKEKLPHFTRRKDGQLMCFAGLWDCVQYEDSDEKLYTYTIITTDSNQQLRFLHDRMPVILENGSEAIRTWLDPERTEWSDELQSLLKPFEGVLECYQVSKDVNKVGNNSPSFVVPIDSAANKNNIANFFGNRQKAAAKTNIKVEHDVDRDGEDGDARETTDVVERSEDNAPLPIPEREVKKEEQEEEEEEKESGIKLESGDGKDDEGRTAGPGRRPPKRKMSDRHAPQGSQSPATKMRQVAAKKATRSATSNGSSNAAKSRLKGDEGSRKITSFFKK